MVWVQLPTNPPINCPYVPRWHIEEKQGQMPMADNHDTTPGLATINNVRWHIVNVDAISVGPRDINVPMHR